MRRCLHWWEHYTIETNLIEFMEFLASFLTRESDETWLILWSYSQDKLCVHLIKANIALVTALPLRCFFHNWTAALSGFQRATPNSRGKCMKIWIPYCIRTNAFLLGNTAVKLYCIHNFHDIKMIILKVSLVNTWPMLLVLI